MSVKIPIELQENITSALNHVIESVNLGKSTMEEFRQIMSNPIDAYINTDSIDYARDAFNRISDAVSELETAMQGMSSFDLNNPAGGADIGLPTWQTDNLPVFTGTGIDRFEQEIQSANNMLNTLNETQHRIITAASGTDIFPDAAISDVIGMQNRLQTIQQQIQMIENNPINLGSDLANRELEQLRSQFDRLTRKQQELNDAVSRMDISRANAAYLRLSQTVSGTERYLRDNVNAQGQFNNMIEQGASKADKLSGMIKNAALGYVGIQTVGKVFGLSDSMTQTTARLGMMNDGIQTTDELINMVYASAQNARGSFQEMADVAARFGNNAGDAFESTAEVVAFTELVQKQMTIAGASTQEASNAMLQLSQALGSGVLRGDELNSIFEQAPNLIQTIADYLDVPIGSIREMAADGQISADIVKAAMFSAADDINQKFESMPMTWGQIWTSFKNTALTAFQGILGKINEIGNSEGFRNILKDVQNMLPVIAGVVSNVFNMLAPIGVVISLIWQAASPVIYGILNGLSAVTGVLSIVAEKAAGLAQIITDNWSWISPLIYDAVEALGAYYTALGLLKTAQAAFNFVSGIGKGILAGLTFVKDLCTGASIAQMKAMFAETAAQEGLNAALYACPITWIVLAFIAWIAILYAAAAAIAHFTGMAESGFGVICGGINVVIHFFKNLGLEAVNVAIGLWNAMKAAAHNIRAAFNNSISDIKSFFYDLMSTALTVIGNIAAELNKLPFIEFDYSGITGKAGEYAAKALELKGNKEAYEDISEAEMKGRNTFETFKDGWAFEAAKAGIEWGDSIANKVSGFFDGSLFGIGEDNYDDLTQYLKETNKLLEEGNDINSDKNIGNVGDVKNVSGDVSVADGFFKAWSELASMEYMQNINQNHIAPIINVKIAEVRETADIDKVIDRVTLKVGEAMSISAEGAH